LVLRDCVDLVGAITDGIAPVVALTPITTVNYSGHVVEVVRSATFDRWLRKLKDRRAVGRILVRIDRLATGNPGDVKPAARQSPICASTTNLVTGCSSCATAPG